jgi:hypothetical protein
MTDQFVHFESVIFFLLFRDRNWQSIRNVAQPNESSFWLTIVWFFSKSEMWNTPASERCLSITTFGLERSTKHSSVFSGWCIFFRPHLKSFPYASVSTAGIASIKRLNTAQRTRSYIWHWDCITMDEFGPNWRHEFRIRTIGRSMARDTYVELTCDWPLEGSWQAPRGGAPLVGYCVIYTTWSWPPSFTTTNLRQWRHRTGECRTTWHGPQFIACHWNSTDNSDPTLPSIHSVSLLASYSIRSLRSWSRTQLRNLP